MKFASFRTFRAILALSALSTATGFAAETATISAGTVNVRGRAGFIGEVITRLNQGDPVTILEAVTLKNPKAGEPADWLKIALPANTPVWVHTSFVDAATQTINASRLKVRGGPGINYSVLGYLSQGTTVKEISRKGDWMEIEPTEELFAFVAASMVTRGPTAAPTEAVAVAAVPATTPDASATTTPAPTETVVVPAETTPAETSPVASPVAETPVAPPATEVSTPAPPAPVTTAPASTTIVAEPAPAIATAPTSSTRELTVEERAQQVLEKRTRDSQRWEVTSEPNDQLLKELPEIRRVVTREGRIRHTVSIQAPSPYYLSHLESTLRLNYLYTTATNLPLKDLTGVKVRIKGEEGIDPRWPGVPVLLIKSLEVLP